MQKCDHDRKGEGFLMCFRLFVGSRGLVVWLVSLLIRVGLFFN